MRRVNKHYWADKDIQIVLGTLLRVGVIVSMVVIVAGGLLYVLRSSGEYVNYSSFDSRQAEFSSIADIFSGSIVFNPKAVIQIGILLLIFTPVVRVVFSIFSFLIEKDYLYVAIGLIVLTVIMFSLSNSIVH
jgi:uncharacterized membrane protein